MNTKQKIFCGVWVFAIIASAQAATTSSGITNKTSRFSDVLSEMGAATTDSSNAELAETIRRQRALLDAQADKANTADGTSNITNANACDSGLRKCMTEKCGTDFTKCASDSTTTWGNKMDSCRRNTKCTGHEYTLLAPEILADRNAAIELSYYNSVVSCGNKYNDCMFTACGKTLEKCLSKSAGDSAMAKCKSIADECREQDSGLAGRISGVFGDLRTVAAAGAQKDEKRLYELRDLMRNICTRFGAMFDERTLDCVYTVNFFAGEDHTLMASKKLYSGDTFQCTPDWFGVDITTYIENAQRLTRSQKSASAAAMGAGVGTAAGLVSSGAIGRAIDTQNAEKQAKEACTNDGGEWVSAGFNKGNKCDMTNAKENCTKMNGKWDGEKCVKDNNSTLTETSSTGGGRNQGETPEAGADPNALTLTTENPQKIGKPCGNKNAGTWISCNDAFCGEECYDNKKDEQVSCACVQTACLKRGKINNYYTILDDVGACPFTYIKCDGMTSTEMEIGSEAPNTLGSHSTNFDGQFCLEENIKNDAKCKITSIGLNPMVGTMKELKEALKENDNKLIMCSDAIDLKKTYKFGQSCETNSSNNTEKSSTTSKGSSHMRTKNGQDLATGEYDESSENGVVSSGHRMSTKPNDTQQSGGSGTKTCQQVCADIKKTFSVDLFHKKLPISNPSCENTCDPDLKDFCKSFATKKEIIQFGNSKHRILWASSSWRDGMYGCQWSGETVAQNQSQSVQCDTYLTSGKWQPKCTTTTQRI